MTPASLLLAFCLVVASGSAATAQPPKPPLTPTQDLEKNAPTAAQALARSAIAAMRQGQLDTARRDFEKILQLVPGNIPTTINLALIDYGQKDLKQAEARLKNVARADPENGLPWLMLGVIYYEQDKLDAALAALGQAVLYAPKDARAHHFLGVTIGKKGWYSGAEDELRKAIALDPKYAEAHFNLAIFYLQRTPPSIELARRHYEKSLDLGGAPDADVAKRLAGNEEK